jgi:hypothetical protein
LTHIVRMQAVIEIPGFDVDAKAAGLTDEDRRRIVDRIGADPQAGDVIVGTGGARKVRFAGRGKGKSGGFRVITYFAGDDTPVFLISVFGKGDRVDLSQAERNALRRELAGMVEDYKNGVRVYVQGRQQASRKRP